ncbi:hypothetical protein PIB30_089329, partial [Stylosanthes scabra]|nr:hypothetical protein [Stylosanthes scabra]
KYCDLLKRNNRILFDPHFSVGTISTHRVILLDPVHLPESLLCLRKRKRKVFERSRVYPNRGGLKPSFVTGLGEFLNTPVTLEEYNSFGKVVGARVLAGVGGGQGRILASPRYVDHTTHYDDYGDHLYSFSICLAGVVADSHDSHLESASALHGDGW